MFCVIPHAICVTDGICQYFFEGWVIDPYEQSLFNCPGKVQVLPSNDAEVVNISFVTWDVAVVMNGRGGQKKANINGTHSSATVTNVVIPSTTIMVKPLTNKAKTSAWW